MVDLVEIRFFGCYTMPPNVVLKKAETYPAWKGIIGYLNGLRLTLTEAHLTVRGSLPKFLRGNNIELMSVSDVILALQQLEKELGFDISHGVVRELEVGSAIGVDCPSSWYTATWGLVPRFEKATFGNGQTVLYRTKSRSMQGYDKAEESKRTPGHIPLEFYGKHYIRLEYKLKAGIARKFGRTLYVRDLMTPEVTHLLMEEWAAFYAAIPKHRKHFIPCQGSKKVFFSSLISFGIGCIGGPEYLSLDIRGRADLTLDQRNDWTRELVRVSQDCRFTTSDQLTEELDAKVSETLQACWD